MQPPAFTRPASNGLDRRPFPPGETRPSQTPRNMPARGARKGARSVSVRGRSTHTRRRFLPGSARARLAVLAARALFLRRKLGAAGSP